MVNNPEQGVESYILLMDFYNSDLKNDDIKLKIKDAEKHFHKRYSFKLRYGSHDDVINQIDKMELSDEPLVVATVIKNLVTIICERDKKIQGSRLQFINKCFEKIDSRFQINIVNCAAILVDQKFMSSLLIYPAVSVDLEFRNLTPLNILAKHLTPENFNETYECIKLLINYGANPNLPDNKNYTPVLYVLNNPNLDENQGKRVLEYFLNHSEIELDKETENRIKREFRNINTQIYDKRLQRLKFSGLLYSSEQYETLVSNLENSEEQKFLELFNLHHETSYSPNAYMQYLHLLILAIERGLHKAFDVIVRTKLNFNFRYKGYTPIQIACNCGNVFALQMFLSYKHIKIDKNDNLLIAVITKLDSKLSDYKSCFYALLDSNLIDINEADYKGDSALHYAVRENKTEAIRELLRRGAYIGAINRFEIVAIDKIRPKILKEHFDSCINTNEWLPSIEASTIIFDYVNLIPHKKKNDSIGNTTEVFQGEITPIKHIANSKDLCHLLNHPLITSILYLKWMSVSKVFMWNCLYYLILLSGFIFALVLELVDGRENNITAFFVWCLMLSGCFQFVILSSPKLFFTNIINYLDLLLIFLLILNNIYTLNFGIEFKKFLVISIIFVGLMNIYLRVRILPVTSTYILLFETVSLKFMKFFAFIMLFFLGFSSSFFIIFGNPQFSNITDYSFYPDLNITENNDTRNSTEEKENIHEFNSLSIAHFKTFIMMTGEFDAGDIHFNSVLSYFLFVIFVFFMSIVLSNLLNVFAIDDSQAIMNEAKLYHLINITKILSTYDEAFTDKYEKRFKPSFCKGTERSVRKKYNNMMLFKYEYLQYKLEIQISNRQITLVKAFKNTDTRRFKSDLSLINPQIINCRRGLFDIFEEVFKEALSIIDQKQEQLKLEMKSSELENHLTKIESRIKKLQENFETKIDSLNLDIRLIKITEDNKTYYKFIQRNFGTKMDLLHLESRLRKLIKNQNENAIQLIDHNSTNINRRNSF